jgi:hypothetical protein
VLSITGAGAAAKSLFNMTTAVGRSLAGGVAALGRGGSLTSAIEGLAGRAGAVATEAAEMSAARAEAGLVRAEAGAARAEAQAAARAEARAAQRAESGATRGANAAEEAPASRRSGAPRVRKFDSLDDFNRAANKAEANTVYEYGNYKWVTDDAGRVSSVEGKIDLTKHGRVTTDGLKTSDIGASVDARTGDVGFHLVGDQFNGPINKLNVVPGNGVSQNGLKNLNQSGYKMWENEVAAQARGGANVEVRIESTYSPGNVTTRPDTFRASYRVNGGDWVTSIFRNRAGG